MNKYENYREVDIPWIRKIPYHWEVTRLKSIIYKSFSGIWGNDSKNDYNDIICIRITNFHQELINIDNNKLLKRNYTGLNIGEKLIRKEDILIEKSGGGEITPVGRVAYNNLLDNVLCTNFINVIRVNNQVNSRYISYFLHLKHVLREVKKDIKQTTGIQNLDFNEYISKKVLIPTLLEQQQIANYLDWKIEKIDKLIGIEKKKLEELENCKRSYLVSLIKNHEKNEKIKNISNFPEITEINEDYSIVPLFSISKENKEKNKNKNNNLLSLSYGNIIKKNIATTKGLLPENFDSYQIVDYGMTVLRLTDLQNDKKSLRTGFVREKGIITSAYTALIPDETKVRGEYLHIVLHNYDILKIFYRLGTGMRQALSYNDLKKLPIILPSLEIQEQIIRKIKDISKDIENIKERINDRINHYTSLKESLISEVVTGQIDVRNVKIPEKNKK